MILKEKPFLICCLAFLNKATFVIPGLEGIAPIGFLEFFLFMSRYNRAIVVYSPN